MCTVGLFTQEIFVVVAVIGVSGGAASPPGLKIFRANSTHQGKHKLLKNPK